MQAAAGTGTAIRRLGLLLLREGTEVLIFHPILVATGSEDEEGHLALHDGKLVAILVRLDGVEHMEERGRLYLEASFGPLTGIPAPTFAGLEEAAGWLEAELGAFAGPDEARSPFPEAGPRRS